MNDIYEYVITGVNVAATVLWLVTLYMAHGTLRDLEDVTTEKE